MSCFLENWLACCEFSKRMETHHFQINRNYFWRNLWFTAGGTIKFKQFIREKNIILHEDYVRNNSSVLTIGLDPENQFNVAACFIFPSGSFILDVGEIQDLLEHVDHQQDLKSEYEELDEFIDCIPLQEYKLYVFKVCGKRICIDEKSSDALHRMKSYILKCISMLENEVMLCEKAFFKLLDHFHRGKTIQASLDLSQNDDYLRHFFNTVIEAKCEAIDEDFVLDIALKFEKFFVKSLPVFIKTLMLRESERIQTFNTENWPHPREAYSHSA